VTDLKTIELSNDMRICSFDIDDMYITIIPKRDIINVINSILESNTKVHTNNQNEIIQILQIVVEQNYFQFEKQYYKQTDGLAMGVPTSARLAETCIEHMEHKHIYPVLNTQQTIAYFIHR
jgi:hypothetical protein